jgi:hypothetical protein
MLVSADCPRRRA